MLCGPTLSPRGTPSLFAQNFLDLPDFFLNFPADLFGFPFGFEIGIIRQLPRFFLHFSFQVMKLALYFILCAWLHWIPSSQNLICFSLARRSLWSATGFLIYFSRAPRMAAFTLNVRNLFHRFALHAAILSGHGGARAVRMSAFLYLLSYHLSLLRPDRPSRAS